MSLSCFIKFGKKEHIESLLKSGEIYFNTPKTFSDSKEPEKGDSSEGAIWLDNAQLTDIKVEHPTIGIINLIPKPNSLSKITQYHYNFLSFSLYDVSQNIVSNSEIKQIDERMIEFGDSALIIKKPIKFIESIISELKKQNIRYELKPVEYKELSEKGKHIINPFVKDEEYKHQNEYRIIIENLNNKPFSINIGSIEDYCLFSESESMIKTEWSVKPVKMSEQIKFEEGS
jgi:hypothetical protein